MIIVGNCGFDSRHRAGFDIRRPNGNGFYTLIFIKTEAFFEIDGEIVNTAPNTAILYDKTAYVHYGCGSILQRRKIWSKNYRSR